jgi:hypothetical protein
MLVSGILTTNKAQTIEDPFVNSIYTVEITHGSTSVTKEFNLLTLKEIKWKIQICKTCVQKPIVVRLMLSIRTYIMGEHALIVGNV